MSNLDELYQQGVGLVWPHLLLADRTPEIARSAKAQAQLTQGIRSLRKVIAFRPDNWSAHWLLGKAFEAIDNQEAFYDSLHTAYAINPVHVDICREFMQSCLRTSRTSEAVEVAKHAIALQPENHGLLANLALALMLDGQIANASLAIEEAIQAAPENEAIQSLRSFIGDVKIGKRGVPKRWP